MTRCDRGRRHKWWRESELAYIREHAGRVPAREIRKALRVSREQLKGAVRWMRRRGEDVDLRCFSPRTVVCPSCGMARTLFGSEGICEPCRISRRLAETEAEIAGLLPLLSPADRAVYERTEAKRETRADPMPAAPRTAGMTAYERARAEERRDMAMERWQADRLRRLLKAAQKRKERVSRKVGKGRK
ncbi:hypothetical protein [Paratractidigestivibacter faecalis]|uniref:hypothetical protein n=1 Tax=Paratractidigestivibacter faecalis TaxID=2292441 RepID=UPI003A91360A